VNALLRESLALWIALVFAAAAAGKLMAWSELPGVVRNFRVLPRWLVLPVSMALPPLEAAIAAGVVVEAARPAAAMAAAVLLAVFGAALAINLHRGRREIDCGCFRSDLKQPITIALVLRNLMLVACALLLVPPGAGAVLSALEWAMAGGAAVTLFLCYLSIGGVFRAPPSYADKFMPLADSNARVRP
jgi:hypothetical protein